MYYQPNINFKFDIKAIALTALAIIILGFLLNSCNPDKKIQRDNQKAVARVEANIELVKQVRGNTNPLFPCTADTFTVKVHDTTIVNKVQTKRDTSYQIHNDTVYTFYTDTIYTEKTNTVYSEKVTVDNNALKASNDSLNVYKLSNANKDGQILTLVNEYNSQKGRTDLYFWLFIGSCLIIVVLIYFYFNKP